MKDPAEGEVKDPAEEDWRAGAGKAKRVRVEMEARGRPATRYTLLLVAAMEWPSVGTLKKLKVGVMSPFPLGASGLH